MKPVIKYNNDSTSKMQIASIIAVKNDYKRQIKTKRFSKGIA